MVIIEVRNAELIEALTLEAAARGIADAAVVALMGGVDSFTVSTPLATDATQNVATDYGLPAELHGSGDVRGGVVHLHATLAVEGDRAISGHLHRAQIGTWYARAYLIPA